VGKWGGAYDASLFGPSDDGFLHNLSQTSLLAQNSNGTTPVAADSDPIGWAKSTVASQRIATQATTSARPFWKTPNFARFDGTDDNWLTTFNPTAALTIMIRAKLTSGSAIKMMMGCCDAGTTNRLQLETNASDQLEVRVGSDGARAMAGSILNVVGVYGIRLNGVNVDTIRDGAIAQTYPQVGAPTTTTPIRIGAFNNAGTASNFFPGDIYNALAINRALTPAEILNLSNYWNAQ
jgi:hypothetical protein